MSVSLVCLQTEGRKFDVSKICVNIYYTDQTDLTSTDFYVYEAVKTYSDSLGNGLFSFIIIRLHKSSFQFDF